MAGAPIDLLDLFLVGLEAVTEAEDNILLTVHDSIEGHEHSAVLTDNGSQRRTGDFHSGSAEIAVDEHIVEDDIDDICHSVIDHRSLGVADTAEGSSDGRSQSQTRQTDHLDAQIIHTGPEDMILTGAHEFDEPGSGNKADHRKDAAQNEGHQQSLPEDFIGFFLIAGALVPGDHGSSTHIHCHEHGHEQEFGLCSQTHGSQGPGTQLTYHHQVDHGSELCKGQLYEGRPGDMDNIAVQHFGFDPLRERLGDFQIRHAIFFIGAHRHQIQSQGAHFYLAFTGFLGGDGTVFCFQIRHLSKPLFVKNQRRTRPSKSPLAGQTRCTFSIHCS